ncbi:hypothetical protein [Planomonospora algeriensis]
MEILVEADVVADDTADTMLICRPRTALGSGKGKLLQGRVRLDVYARARRGAAVRGVRIAQYLVILVEADPQANPVEQKPMDQLSLSA